MDRQTQPDPAPIKKLAIVGPSFFSYIEGIAAEFSRRGIEVATFDDRHSNRAIEKIFIRLGVYRHAFSPAAKHVEAVAEAIEAGGYSDVLLANIEAVDRGFVARLRARGVRAHLYMWDGLSNRPGYAALLDLVASRGTFDPVDAERLDMRYIPLFAEPIFAEEDVAAESFEADIGFCGTVHSSRTRILARLIAIARARGLKLALMLYYHLRALFLLKALVDWSAWKLAPKISSTPFPKAQVAAMFGRTRFILDVPHPGQSGMTARTFEALRAGARLLTFNRSAATLLPQSLQQRVHIIDSIEEAAAIDFASCGRMPPLSPEERYFLSIDRFVDQLLDMMGASAPASASRAAAPA